MQINLKACESDIKVSLRLSDERRALANFLSILDDSKIDELEICDLTENKLPKNIQRLTNLKVLRLIRCHSLTTFPSEIASCECLRELGFIKCADFHDLEGISELSDLRVLHISGCESFEELPEELREMCNLQALDLSYSEGICWLPIEVLPKSLRLLDMHGCWRCQFSEHEARNLKLVSLQIQDLARIPNLNTAESIPELISQLHHSMTLRDGCGLDE